MKRALIGLALLAAAGCAVDSSASATVDALPTPGQTVGADLYNAPGIAFAHGWQIDHPQCPMTYCGIVLRLHRDKNATETFEPDWSAIVLSYSDGKPIALDASDCDDAGPINLMVDVGDNLAWTGDDTTICNGQWSVAQKTAVNPGDN